MQARETGETPRIVLITPVRNEAATLERTIASVAAQTLRPTRWIIVDDGSKDQTPTILDIARRAHSWIQVVRREDRGIRSVGKGVIEAFYDGLDAVEVEYDFVGKLDGDLEFSASYLEHLMAYFRADPQLAAASGTVFCERKGELVEEFSMIDEMVAGCFKLYRKDAFDRIGGFVRAVMWDGIDFHRARMCGFRTRNLADPELRIVHLRQMGSSHRGILRGRLRWGEGQWFMGSSFVYVIASGLNRMRERPFVVGGLLIIAGYLRGALLRRPRYEDLEFRRELRRWQSARLSNLLGPGRS